jgi:RNA-directed DNA polymerase
LLRAVARHIDLKWVVMYVERWLKAPMQSPDGTLVQRVKGTPQGSPISPVLANLFLHYRSTRGWPGSSQPSRSSALQTMR